MHINSNEFDTDMDGEIYYTTPIPESKYKRAYLKMCFENHIERYISYYFPLVTYHENKNALTAESFGRTSNSIDFMDTMGFYPRDGVFVADVKDWTEMEDWVIGDRSLELMDDMVAALQEKRLPGGVLGGPLVHRRVPVFQRAAGILRGAQLRLPQYV